MYLSYFLISCLISFNPLVLRVSAEQDTTVIATFSIDFSSTSYNYENKGTLRKKSHKTNPSFSINQSNEGVKDLPQKPIVHFSMDLSSTEYKNTGGKSFSNDFNPQYSSEKQDTLHKKTHHSSTFSIDLSSKDYTEIFNSYHDTTNNNIEFKVEDLMPIKVDPTAPIINFSVDLSSADHKNEGGTTLSFDLNPKYFSYNSNYYYSNDEQN